MKVIFEFSKKSYSQNKSDDKNKQVRSSTIALANQLIYATSIVSCVLQFKNNILILEEPQRKFNSERQWLQSKYYIGGSMNNPCIFFNLRKTDEIQAKQ